MNKTLRFGLGLLFASLPFLSVSADITLEYGVNLIDFNGDGVPDVVVKSRQALSESSSIDIVTVYIESSDKTVYIVPSIYANALSLYANKIKGTDIVISDFKFIEKENSVVLLSAEKVGNNLREPTPIRFTSYVISKKENENNHETQFKWNFSSYCVTTTAYISAETSFSDTCVNTIINE